MFAFYIFTLSHWKLASPISQAWSQSRKRVQDSCPVKLLQKHPQSSRSLHQAILWNEHILWRTRECPRSHHESASCPNISYSPCWCSGTSGSRMRSFCWDKPPRFIDDNKEPDIVISSAVVRDNATGVHKIAPLLLIALSPNFWQHTVAWISCSRVKQMRKPNHKCVLMSM
jgi:hypothetical protein